MILIGQYDSSFVRRVGIALTLYELLFEHRPWSTFADAEKIRPYNPLLRVPIMVLDGGEVLIETFPILDYLDSLVPVEHALAPRKEPMRRQALRVSALASGLADMFVSLFYEKRLHDSVSELLVTRRTGQIRGALAVLEADRAARRGDFWFGDRIGHADIAVAAVLRHLNEAHPDIISVSELPALRQHAEKLEVLPVFKAISQPFHTPGVAPLPQG